MYEKSGRDGKHVKAELKNQQYNCNHQRSQRQGIGMLQISFANDI
jgi:hypothetical protein